MKKYLLGLCLVLLATTANAQNIYGGYGMDISCGRYIDDISTDQRAKNNYHWWLGGFVTGTNLVKSRSTLTDDKAYEAWIEKYCRDNPLDSFHKAAIELNKELDNKKE
jgi:hypothetical protein